MAEQKVKVTEVPETPNAPSLPPVTAEQHEQALQEEYGQYEAIGPIDIDRVRAFNVGDPVPVHHVEKFGLLARGYVKKVS